MRFTWDARKATANLRKHGVSFEEAASVFADPLALAVEDAVEPDRALLIGLSDRRRLLLAVYTEIDDDTVRIISARRATSHERRHYEEGT
ncbi:MAG: BrnT family toxin [Myxococcaceae bacterium]